MTLRVHPIIYPLALVSAFAIGQFGCKSEVPELEPVEPMTTSEYVDMVVDYDLELSTLIDDGCLAEDISERLVVLDNTTPEHYAGKYPSVEVMEKPTPEQLEKFHPQYLILIHYLLNALSNSDFRAEIGTELELDTEDTSGEHGGALHLSEDGDVSIEMLADRSSDPSMHFIGDEIRIGSHSRNPDRSYYPADPEYKLDILTMFHFHARYANWQRSAAPSGNDYWVGGAIFTRLGEGKFNVDLIVYYRNDDKSQKVDLDLGVYSYE